MAERFDLGSFLSALPYRLGYELDARHVVAAGLDDSGQVGPMAAMHWDTAVASDRELAEDTAYALARAVQGSDYRRFLLVGYGPDGTARTALLGAALLATADVPEPIYAHIDAGTWRTRLPGSPHWSPPQPLPDVAVEAVLQGVPAPATSRDEFTNRFEPLPEPLYTGVSDRDAAVLADSAPSFRYDVARRTLEHLASPGLDDVSRMATLAHLTVKGGTAVRDKILVDAAQNPALADALVRTYRGAPETIRPALATVAATALYLTGAASPAVNTILRHADREGPNASLTRLVETAKNRGVDPLDLRRFIGGGISAQIDLADTEWNRERTSAVQRASFPNPARASTHSNTPDVARTARASEGHHTNPGVER